MPLNFKYSKPLTIFLLLILSYPSFAQNKSTEKIEKIVIKNNIRTIKEYSKFIGEYFSPYGDYSGRCSEYEIGIINASFNEKTADNFSFYDVKPNLKGKFILKKDGEPDFDLTDYFFNKFKLDDSGVACVVYVDKKK